MNKKGQCRWCGRKLYWDYLYKHEPECLRNRQHEVAVKLEKAACLYRDYQLGWSIDMATRWHSLPGKGWGFLDEVPMVELVSIVRRTDERR